MLTIEFARRQRRWSQIELGQQTRITQAFISLIETGRGIPRADQLDRLARVLDLAPDEVLRPVLERPLSATTETEPSVSRG